MGGKVKSGKETATVLAMHQLFMTVGEEMTTVTIIPNMLLMMTMIVVSAMWVKSWAFVIATILVANSAKSIGMRPNFTGNAG